MKRALPLTLIIAGLLLIMGGFVYDVIYAGIPYQDPTPEMSARYAFHARVASISYLIGAGVFVVGVVVAISRVLMRRLKSRD